MRALLRGLASAVLAAFLPCVAFAGDNYQGLWWNASESGWGIALAHQGDAVMATWLTYDNSGQGRWLAIVAQRSGEDTYAGTVYEASVPSFIAIPFESPWVTRAPVGEGALSFTDEDHGTLRYVVRGIADAKAITREAFGPLPDCTYAAQPTLANAINYTDLWWAAHGTEPGWGVSLAHQGGVIFATWFTYDRLGAPIWFVASAPRIAGKVYGGTLFRTTGPVFGAVFDPALVKSAPAGTATFTFSNGNAATFTYTMDGVTRTKALSRELFAPPAATVCRDAATAAIQGRVFEGAGVAATVCADADGNGQCDAGEPQAATDAAGAYTLAAPGYTGPLVAEVSGGYRMASPGIDYSANITPYTTLVQLTGEREFSIAEMMVRNVLGLPQRFAIRLDAPPAEGSLTQSVARSIVAALKSTSPGVPGADAIARVAAAFPPALAELPQLRITTKGGAPVDSKEVYVDATFVLTNPAAAIPTATLAGKIRGRGNFTWMQPKKPYKVQFANDAAWAALPDVLGMTKNRNWALLADYLDRSLMRNQLAFTLANSSIYSEGLKWASATVRLEVWLNGEYEGLYTLTEDIRVDKTRLDIRAIGTGDLDGGYLVEVDWPLDCYNDGRINLQHGTPQGVHVCLKTPDEGSATQAQIAWIDAYIDAAERDLYEHGATERLNLVSYVDWYLLNEFVRNYDAPFYSSDYMWKDTVAAAVPADRLLNMGPPWDFDISGGNINVANNWLPQGCWVDKPRIADPLDPAAGFIGNWYTRLSGDDQFVALAVARWKDKRGALGRLTDASIATWSHRLEAAAARNFARWPLMGEMLSVDEFTLHSWPEHIAYLKNFLDQRLVWMDEAFASPAQFTAMCR